MTNKTKSDIRELRNQFLELRQMAEELEYKCHDMYETLDTVLEEYMIDDS